MRKKKKTLVFLLCLLLILSTMPVASQAEEGLGSAQTAELLEMEEAAVDSNVITESSLAPEEPAAEETPDEAAEEPAEGLEKQADDLLPQETGAGADAAQTEAGTEQPAEPEQPVAPEQPTEREQTAEQGDVEKAKAISVTFLLTPEETEFTVYAKDDRNGKNVIEAEKDGTYLLLPGEYYYDVTAEGYLTVEEETIIVDEKNYPALEIKIPLAKNDSLKAEDNDEEIEASLFGGTESDAHLASETSSSGSCGPNLTWTLDDQGVLTISGSGAMNSYMTFKGEPRAPWYSRRNDIKKLVIREGVTALGACAFLDCTNLTSAIVPEGIRSLPFQVFRNCIHLTELKLPGTLEMLDNECLWYIGITEFMLPASVTQVKEHFYGAQASKILADPANPNYTDVDGVLFSKDRKTLVMYPEMKGTDYTVPEGTQIIRGHAFAYNSVLEQIIIPASVQEIQAWGFCGASQLKTVYYYGNNDTWNSIVSKENNDALLNATVNFLEDQFIDVSNRNDYFYEPVYWAVDRGITTGRTSTFFDPYGECTRGHIVTFLWRAMGQPEPSIRNPFTDVKESDNFYKAVLWAYENGITTGQTATSFGPWKSCTRGQIVTFLWRAKGEPNVSGSNPFVDVKKSDYFYKAVLWAAKNGITTGKTPTSFVPYSTCTRGQAVTFLYRSDRINDNVGTRVFNVAYNQGTNSPEYAMLEKISEDLYAATNGRYSLELFPDAALGSQTQTLEMVMDGSVDMTVVSNIVIEAYSPDFSILGTPCIYDSITHQERVFTSGNNALKALYGTTEDMGFTVLSSFTAGARNIYTRDKRVFSVNELEGMKIRVMNNNTYINAVNAMGAVPVAMAMGEVYTALQMGVVDGAENTICTYRDLVQYEVAPYYNLTCHLILPDHLAMSAEVLSSMSAEDQMILRNVCRDAIAYCYEEVAAQETAARAELESKGVAVTETDTVAFRTRCAELISAAANQSSVTEDIYEMIQEKR